MFQYQINQSLNYIKFEFVSSSRKIRMQSSYKIAEIRFLNILAVKKYFLSKSLITLVSEYHKNSSKLLSLKYSRPITITSPSFKLQTSCQLCHQHFCFAFWLRRALWTFSLLFHTPSLFYSMTQWVLWFKFLIRRNQQETWISETSRTVGGEKRIIKKSYRTFSVFYGFTLWHCDFH